MLSNFVVDVEIYNYFVVECRKMSKCVVDSTFSQTTSEPPNNGNECKVNYLRYEGASLHQLERAGWCHLSREAILRSWSSSSGERHYRNDDFPHETLQVNFEEKTKSNKKKIYMYHLLLTLPHPQFLAHFLKTFLLHFWHH